MGAILAKASGRVSSRFQPSPETPNFPEPHLSSLHICSCNIPGWEKRKVLCPCMHLWAAVTNSNKTNTSSWRKVENVSKEEQGGRVLGLG